MSTRTELTLAQAAAALSVSEKTLRRRIKAGKIEARKAPIEGGGLEWRIYLDDDTRVAATDKTGAQRTNADARAMDVPEVVPESQRSDNGRAGIVVDATDTQITTQRPNVPEPSDTRNGQPNGQRSGQSETSSRDESTVELIVLLREQLAAATEREKRASLQIEAANRQSAEATAALREYLKLQAKALPSPTGESSTQNLAKVEAPRRPDTPQSAGTRKVSSDAKIGERGEGLRDLRTILKKVFGVR